MIYLSRPIIDKEILKELKTVLSSEWIIDGQKVKEFENKLEKILGQKVITVNSGTTALMLLLFALKNRHPKKNEVIVPGYSCTSIYYAVKSAGLVPKVVDINPHTYSVDLSLLKKSLTKKTLAIIIVHTFGMVDRILDSLDNLPPIIEDCAHTVGCKYHNKPVGTFGCTSMFSFSATKFLHTVYGGAITSKDKKLLLDIRDLKISDSLTKKFKIGFNVSLSDVYAVFGLFQLKKLKEIIKKRRKIAEIYDSVLNNKFEVLRDYSSDSFYRYIIKTKNGNQLQKIRKLFRKNGIYADKPIDKPIFLLDKENKYQGCKEVFEATLAIPIYPNLTKEETKYIANVLSKI